MLFKMYQWQKSSDCLFGEINKEYFYFTAKRPLKMLAFRTCLVFRLSFLKKWENSIQFTSTQNSSLVSNFRNWFWHGTKSELMLFYLFTTSLQKASCKSLLKRVVRQINTRIDVASTLRSRNVNIKKYWDVMQYTVH